MLVPKRAADTCKMAIGIVESALGKMILDSDGDQLSARC